MKIICDCGSDKVDIMSVTERFVKKDNQLITTAEITYICINCGNIEEKIEYLYKLKKAKFKNQ